MIRRAGRWRRVLAALIDLLIAMSLAYAVAALAFGPTNGRLTMIDPQIDCQPLAAAAPRPEGLAMAPTFRPSQWSICQSELFGRAISRVLVAHDPDVGETRTQSVALAPDNTVVQEPVLLDNVELPLFLLLRWLFDRFAGGSPGRRLAGLVLAERTEDEVVRASPVALGLRYRRFGRLLLPGLALGTGHVAANLLGLEWPSVIHSAEVFSAAWVQSAVEFAAGLAILAKADPFYDAGSATLVVCRRTLPAAAADPLTRTATPAPALRPVSAHWPVGTFAIAAALVLVFVLEGVAPLSPPTRNGFVSGDTLMAFGAANRDLVLVLWQPYRLLASVFLHRSVVHLANVLQPLLVVGWLLETVAGPGCLIALFIFGALAASTSAILLNGSEVLEVGASGALVAVSSACIPLATRVEGQRRYWMLAWAILILTSSFVVLTPPPQLQTVEWPSNLGGALCGLILGTGLALTWRRGPTWRPRPRLVIALAAALAVALLGPISVAGWRAPIVSARLVPAGELPRDAAGWRIRGAELAARYPDDPRPLVGLATLAAEEGRTVEALARLEAALAAQKRLRRPEDRGFEAMAHQSLGAAFFLAGDFASAITQSTLALAVADHDNAWLRIVRGLSAFYSQHLPEALADLRRAVDVAPDNGYAVLWLSIVAARMEVPDPIATTSKEVDPQAWPGPIVRFFAGTLAPASLETLAREADLRGGTGRVCEARFFEGEHELMEGDVRGAAPRMAEALRICPPGFVEYRAATEERLSPDGAD